MNLHKRLYVWLTCLGIVLSTVNLSLPFKYLHLSDFFCLSVLYFHLFVQAIGGHRRWAQWHPVRVCAFGGARLAGLHFYQADGPYAAAKWRKTSFPEHCSRCTGWNFCWEVSFAGCSKAFSQPQITIQLKIINNLHGQSLGVANLSLVSPDKSCLREVKKFYQHV